MPHQAGEAGRNLVSVPNKQHKDAADPRPTRV